MRAAVGSGELRMRLEDQIGLSGEPVVRVLHARKHRLWSPVGRRVGRSNHWRRRLGRWLRKRCCVRLLSKREAAESEDRDKDNADPARAGNKAVCDIEDEFQLYFHAATVTAKEPPLCCGWQPLRNCRHGSYLKADSRHI